MKLDSIVYDYSSLQEAISKTLNEESPSFKAIYPSDTATSLVNVFASYGAMVSYQIVSAMANAYTDTAYSETGIHQLAETLGNRLHGNISSEIYVSIERTTLRGIQNVIIPVGSKFVIGDLNFFNSDAIIFPLNGDKIDNVRLIQGKLQTAEYVTTGIANERFYFCDDFKCNTNLVSVYVNDTEWSTDDSFLPYVITDTSVENEAQTVVLKTDPDGRTYIKFGNNTNGIIPSSGSVVKVEYVSNEGANGNLNNTDLEINLNTPIYYTTQQNERVRLEVKVSATTTASGGFNTQSLDVLRESSPYVFGSGQRAIRRNDYKSMLLNRCGYLTCNVWGEYEEAKINGGYDKIMMNMVYYTGIKSIQQYTAQPIDTIDISLDAIRQSSKPYFDMYGDLGNARGFYGSYFVDISSYDLSNSPIQVRYRDKYGTGVLTCDPTVNEALGLQASDFERKIYPINDLDPDKYVDDISQVSGENYYTLAINQRYNTDPSQGEVDTEENDPHNLVLPDKEFISSGKNIELGQNTIVNFDSPFQIKLDYANPVAVSAFAFKRPDNETDYKYFIHKFAIYGTNEDISTNEPWYDNVKNNNKWIKLTGIQTIENELDPNEYSDWITLKTYNPESSSTTEEIIDTSYYNDAGGQITNPNGQRMYPGSASFVTDNNWFRLTKTTGITTDYTFSVTVDSVTKNNSEYSILTSSIATGTTYIHFNSPIDNSQTIIVTSTVNDWNKYQHYLIEVYGIHDTSLSSKNANKVAISNMKAIYKDNTSTINYSNKNSVTLKVPVVHSETPARFCLPDEMAFYEYQVEVSGLNQLNGYETGDILEYTYAQADNISYTFYITVTNAGTGAFEPTLRIDNNVATPVLRGKTAITVVDANLAPQTETKSGAKITIKSSSTLKLTGTYTGNYYSNQDIQAFDLPVINKYNHFTTYLEFKQPQIKNISIELNLEYENVSTYQTVKANVVKAINSLFDLKPFSIGQTLNVSDIWKAINNVAGVKRFMVIDPVDNIDCMPYELINLPAENLIINDTINSEYK